MQFQLGVPQFRTPVIVFYHSSRFEWTKSVPNAFQHIVANRREQLYSVLILMHWSWFRLLVSLYRVESAHLST